ncbi:Uncharacterised protein [Mycobacteroides abscessus subsp. abscessus]|nr:Uncharacterised protein [Mycobacteroides abscessus subsp. abscessus]
MKFRVGSFCLPTRSMPRLMSVGKTWAPVAARGADEAPVPAARSRIFMPAFGSTASSTSLRHRSTTPKVISEFIRSYRVATESNMAATSARRLARVARVWDMPPIFPQAADSTCRSTSEQ